MAATAKAKAGTAKGTSKPAKTPKPPPKNDGAKPKKRGTRAKNGRGKKPEVQAAFLATVKAENPAITSEQFALQYNVPPEDVFRLRRFVHEYLQDFNEENAALRMGYPPESARATGKIFLGNAFVQLRVGEILDSMEADKVVCGARVIAALWREANAPDVAFSSNSSTRIAALKTLVKVKGLEYVKPPEDPNRNLPPGGIMIVPMAICPDDWGNHALQSQQALRESVIVDV